MAESAGGEVVRQRKRAAEAQLTRDDASDDDRHDGRFSPPLPGGIADAETMAARRVVKVRRPAGAPPPKPPSGIFASLAAQGAPPAPAPALASTGFGSFSASSPTEPAATADTTSPPVAKPSASGLSAPPAVDKIPSVFGSGTAMTFSFAAAAPAEGEKKEDGAEKATGGSVFGSGQFKFNFQPAEPKEGEAPPATTALPPAQFKEAGSKEATGEEDDEVKMTATVKVMRFDTETKAWSERGVGEMHVNVHKPTGKGRVLVRQSGTLKLIFSAHIDKAFNIGKKPDPKSVIVTTVEGSSSKPESFLLRAIKCADPAAVAKQMLEIFEGLLKEEEKRE